MTAYLAELLYVDTHIYMYIYIYVHMHTCTQKHTHTQCMPTCFAEFRGPKGLDYGIIIIIIIINILQNLDDQKELDYGIIIIIIIIIIITIWQNSEGQ